MSDDRKPMLPPPPPNLKGDAETDDDNLGEDAVMRMILPVGRSVWAIVSGYLGLISVLMIPAPFAIVTGIVAILEIRKNPKKHGMGRAIFGIVMGTICSAVGVIVLVVALMQPNNSRPGW